MPFTPLTNEQTLSPNAKDSTYVVVVDLESPFTQVDNLYGTTIHGNLHIICHRPIHLDPVTQKYPFSYATPKINTKDNNVIKILDKLTHLQRLVNTCINNAERIKEQALKANLTLFQKDIKGREEIMKMDFMKLKENFCDFLKKSSVKEFKNLTNKKIRRDFNDFIIDRNIYTHGIIKLLAFPEDFQKNILGEMVLAEREYDFIIEYIDNIKRDKSFAFITKDIISLNEKVFLELSKLFQDFFDKYNELNLH